MKQELVLLLLVLGWSSAVMVKQASQPVANPSKNSKRELPHGASEQLESSHLFDTHHSEAHHQYGNKLFKEVTITKNIPVPYPIKIERHVAVPVQIPFPVAVQKKIPIVVERKIPIYVEKPIPVQVDRPFPYPLPIEVPVFHKVAVEVPKPYPVHVPSPYPVYIEKPMYVEAKRKRVTNSNKVKLMKHRH
ncbi:mantle protein-like isoform X1 [Culex pipiens pallens]|uniref:mantle protein-like isoform X1 n=1 Tax=Culex pipiens pallens TaxID=42434 RepID=UPI001953E380|nr:mantle protein-like isoform X1 [Culex pipiens pallens]